MKVVNPKQMNEIDSIAINRFGIPGIVLMENAALKVVDEIAKSLGIIRDKSIVVFAGKGNNGGDALAAARHLFNKGAKLYLFITADKSSIMGDARINLDIVEKMGIHAVEVNDLHQIEEVRGRLQTADLIVDGIFGTGFKGEITGINEDVIRLVNSSAKPVIAIDIPSGIDGKTGRAAGVCIKALKTVTFHLPKLGLVIHPGCEYTGELIAVDIGIPEAASDSLKINISITGRKAVVSCIPPRYIQSNKGSYGKVFFLTGSIGMTGAGYLAGSAALRTGSGLVYLGVPMTLTPIYDTLLAEAITLPLYDNNTGVLLRKSNDKVLEYINKMDVAAIGPGLSVNDDITDIVGNIIEKARIPLVLDADALNAISRDVAVLRKLKTQAVLTPHPGEMARLAGITVEEVQNNRIDTALEFACKWKVITILKGAKTVIALPDGTVFINPTGNAGMATAGTGDVLTGIIASLAGQGLSMTDAAVAGVYIHGTAGDNAAEKKGMHGLIARDIVEELPGVIKYLFEEEFYEGKGYHVY